MKKKSQKQVETGLATGLILTSSSSCNPCKSHNKSGYGYGRLGGQLLECIAFAKIASFECIKVVDTGTVEGWAGKLSLSEWLGYGISGRMLGGLWDGQPRAVVSVEGGLCQCPLVASPGKEVKRKQGKGKNQLEGTKQCKTIS